LTTSLYDNITTELQGLYERAWDSHGMLVLDTTPERLLEVVDRLKDRFGFSLFLDVTAVDWLGRREPRFDLVYHFLCPAEMRRVRLKLALAEGALEVPTLTGRYGSARYMEREVHEMYGVRFAGNGDLRPILLYEGFEGHPLRKDYPMELEQPIVPYRK
jgi:NADH:ubiquinone oxidoreductase 27 kD subunit